jgi:N-acetylmuramoyl-L-alanine amidase
MANEYEVAAGECISSISFEHGFFRRTLEEHPKNAELKRKRKDLTMLLPGDVVHIPDKTIKSVEAATNRRHRFRRCGVPEILRLRLLDGDGKPRVGLAYKLQVGALKYEGKTDANGAFQHFIAPDAKLGELVLAGKDGDETYTLQLGRMPPIDEIRGAQVRLHNLGLYRGGFSGEMDEETKRSLFRFQDLNHLSCTGELDGTTKAKLKSGYQG